LSSIIISPILVPDGIPFQEDDPATQEDAGRAKAAIVDFVYDDAQLGRGSD
jgi:hypothetical protein